MCIGGVYDESGECAFTSEDCAAFTFKYTDCLVENPSLIGDGICHKKPDGESGEMYNSPECGYDGGDCDDFNTKYPNCFVDDPSFIGGFCDGNLNTAECGFDFGDCEDLRSKYPDCSGGDNIQWIGNGQCDFKFNTKQCGYDGDDCESFNALPDCNVPDPRVIGDYICQNSTYNTEGCDYDG